MKVRQTIISCLFAAMLLGNLFAAREITDVVRLDSGSISGKTEAGVRTYSGIPYAAPPVGSLRWKPPQNVTPWKDVKQCTEFGQACPQPGYENIVDTSEDCLYLNVWTPAKSPDEKLPVMVWIHGGAWMFGAGSNKAYDGANLARQGVVCVTFNYRLGPFGFLAHPLLSKESPRGVSGNYGLLDQIAALKWVQRNIAAFGGDPGRVTVFGESAGAMSISLLLISPLSQGIFQRAIAESGGPFGYRYIFPQADGPMKKALKMGQKFSAVIKCDKAPDVLAAMRAVTSDAIIRACDLSLSPFPRRLEFAPVIDGYVIPDDPAKLYTLGKQHAVPVIIGSNADEGTGFYQRMSVPLYEHWLKRAFGKHAAEVLALFPAEKREDVKPAFSRLITVAMFAEPARFVAGSMADKHSKAYLYQFTRIAPGARARGLGARHQAEIPYVFGRVEKAQGYDKTDQSLSRQMMAYWVNFARTGNPNGQKLPAWPAYDRRTDRNLEFGDTVKVKKNLLKKECDLIHLLQAAPDK